MNRRLPALVLSTTLFAGAATAEKLVVGFQDMDFYPYGRTSEKDVYVGYLRAVLDAFAADRGHELELAVTPLKRLFLAFRTGDVDLFVPDNPAWSLSYKEGIGIHYSDTIAIALDGFAVLPGREREKLADGIVHLGVILGFTVEPLFDASQRELIVFDRASRFDSLFRSLFLERVDAVYCNQAVASHVLETLGKEPGAIAWNVHLPRFKSEFHVSSSRGELIAELNEWLRAHGDKVQALKRSHGLLDLESVSWGD